jgi:hypothetical protein
MFLFSHVSQMSSIFIKSCSILFLPQQCHVINIMTLFAVSTLSYISYLLHLETTYRGHQFVSRYLHFVFSLKKRSCFKIVQSRITQETSALRRILEYKMEALRGGNGENRMIKSSLILHNKNYYIGAQIKDVDPFPCNGF